MGVENDSYYHSPPGWASLEAIASQPHKLRWVHLCEAFDTVVKEYQEKGKTLEEARERAWFEVSVFVMDRVVEYADRPLSDFEEAIRDDVIEETAALKRWIEESKRVKSSERYQRTPSMDE